MNATIADEIKSMDVNIGIAKEERKRISEALSRLLADSYLLYLKTQNYHWNVTGELFHPLHELFEEQYSELAEAVDQIAERIRALGYKAPGSFREFQGLSTIDEDLEKPPSREMVRQLAADNEKVLRTAREGLQPANASEDEATVDLITQRLHVHSKNAWMLRSHLEE